MAAVVVGITAISYGACFFAGRDWASRARFLLPLGAFGAALAVTMMQNRWETMALQGPLVITMLIALMKQSSFLCMSGRHRHDAADRARNENTNETVEPITLASYLYFLVAPTLFYQTAYPRVQTDLRRVAQLLGQIMAVIGTVCAFISLCWLLPHLEASHEQIRAMDLSLQSFNIDALMLLGAAVPNTLTWVLGVGYGVFHVLLHLQAELTGFGDKQFYGAWWEAKDTKQFWYVHVLWYLHALKARRRAAMWVTRDSLY